MYNGFKNKETWLVNLWLGDTLKECNLLCAEEISEFVHEIVDEERPENGLTSDFISTCLAEVDWRELEEHQK
jgi:hypothetical protein